MSTGKLYRVSKSARQAGGIRIGKVHQSPITMGDIFSGDHAVRFVETPMGDQPGIRMINCPERAHVRHAVSMLVRQMKKGLAEDNSEKGKIFPCNLWKGANAMLKKIMVIEDSASRRELVSFALKDSGYDVITVDNCLDALEKIGREPLSMVITDLNMPVMIGIDFIKDIRSRDKHRGIAIIMLTTESLNEMILEGKAAGDSASVLTVA